MTLLQLQVWIGVTERDRLHSYTARSPKLHTTSHISLVLTFLLDIFVEFIIIFSWCFIPFTLEKATNICLFIEMKSERLKTSERTKLQTTGAIYSGYSVKENKFLQISTWGKIAHVETCASTTLVINCPIHCLGWNTRFTCSCNFTPAPNMNEKCISAVH